MKPGRPHAGLGWKSFGALIAIALLMRLPARLPADWLARTSRGHIMLTRTSGTLWAGHGRLQIGVPDQAWLPVGELAWQFIPPWDNGAPVRLGTAVLIPEAGSSGLDVRTTGLSLPATLLPIIAPVLPAGSTGGHLLFEQLHLALPLGGPMRMEGNFLWQHARLSHPEPLFLDQIAGQVSWQEQGMQRLALDTLPASTNAKTADARIHIVLERGAAPEGWIEPTESQINRLAPYLQPFTKADPAPLQGKQLRYTLDKNLPAW